MTFPLAPLAVEADILLASTWTQITNYVYQREGTSPPAGTGRGRPDETTEVNPSSLTAELNNRGGQFSVKNPTGEYYGLLSRNTPIRLSVPAQYTYLRLENDNESACTCPTSSALNLSGDFDLRIDFRQSGFMRNYAGVPDTILASKAGASGEYSWVVQINGNGTISLYWSANGTALNSVTSTMPVPVGRLTLRITLQVSTGTVTFYTGPASNAASASNWTLLGSSAVFGATSIYATTADVAAGNTSSTALAAWGLLGSVYELALYSGIGGTLVAHPVFTSQPAAASSFADTQGNTWTLYGTAELSGRSYRYHGEMSSLPVAWDVSGNDVRVPLESGGILRRLGQGDAPLYSPMKRALLSQSGTLALVAYWPCEDLQGSTVIGSALGGPLMQVTGGTGDGTTTTSGPAFAANSSFLCSNALPTLNGSSWYGQVPRYTSNGSIVVRFPMQVNTVPSGNRDIIRIITTGTCQEISVRVYSTTSMGIYGNTSAGVTEFTSGSVNFGADLPSGEISGTTLWCSIELQPSGSTVDYTLAILYPGATTAYTYSGSYTGTIGNVTAVYANPAGVYTDSVIGHISVQSAWESLFNLGGPLDAWQGELAGERFMRLCSENSIPCRVYGAPDVTVAMGAQSIDTLTDLLQECEDADRGQIFEPRRSYGIGYRTQASMLYQAPAVTLNYSAAVLGQDDGTIMQPTYDDQYTRNDLIVQRASSQVSGASFQYQLNDGSAMSISPPPTGAGDYSNTESVNVEFDTQLPDMACWMVHIGTVDEARWPSLPINLARPQVAGTALYWAILEADIGDFIEVVNLPGQLPPDPVKQLLWDTKESFGGFWYQMAWTGVPESPYEVAVYNDPVYGRADTDGSALASPAATGAAPAMWGGPDGDGWSGWAGTQATVAVSGTELVITSSGGTGGFWQAYGPAQPCTAGETIAVVAVLTAQQALGAVAVGVHIGGASDTYTASAAVAVTSGEEVILVVTATAVTGQTDWQPYVIDNENSAAGYMMTAAQVYGGVTSTLSVETTATGDPLWTTSSSDFPFDVEAAGERITVAAVTGSSSPQTFEAIRAVNGVIKSQAAGASVRLWFPPVYAML